MTSKLQRIILNAQLAGVDIGLPGQKRRIRQAPAAAASPSPPASLPRSWNAAAASASREYTLPNPFDGPQQITKASLHCFQQRGYYEHNIKETLEDFCELGLDAARLQSGRTYLLLAKMVGPDRQLVAARVHAHVGSGSQADSTFMTALAAHEGRNMRQQHAKATPGQVHSYYQAVIVVPPHDRTNGSIPWFHHNSGHVHTFEPYLNPIELMSRLGGLRLQKLQALKPDWQDVGTISNLPAIMRNATHHIARKIT